MGGETRACQFRVCFYSLADMSPLCLSVTPVSICRPCVHLSPLCLAVTPVSGCCPCVRLSPGFRPAVTPVSVYHHVSGCHHCVHLLPLCPAVAPVSDCHRVHLSPLCLSVAPVSLCHPCVHSIGGPGAREAVCPFPCTAAHSSGSVLVPVRPHFRLTLCNGRPCFLV